MKKHELYWKNIDIGTLKETNWDMRSSGDIQFKFNFLSEIFENNQLASFIKHSIKASRYLDEGDDENYNRMCEEEELKYIDFINSSDWKLINENREEIKILCPIFHDNNEITWQIDLEK
ncbi:hypothetical protein LNI90_11675 [Tenacibaculum dicentrarchi]|nr:hypothetical protein [Tenacibaculum dicentrarchi]MCD8416080.1 hypothetical protein [Tenacibaculum dicentrarchi]MCD8421199.1 hypothetical protein [Tenacibaculum dicentrarchi]MCD8450406.1 hypothetical protein [Tenacibaculum dicentrarchi]MCD8452742.1 hypothetical protein [Tenacibaculum dicentrarchi]